FIGRARDADKNRPHGSVRAAKDGIHRILVLLRLHGHEIERHLDIVGEYLALIERALAELVARLAARDAGQIERYEEDNTLARAAAAIERREENRIFRDRAVRHPGRLLAVQDDLVALERGKAAWPPILTGGMERRAVG